MTMEKQSSVFYYPLFTRGGIALLLSGMLIPIYGFIANVPKEDIIVSLIGFFIFFISLVYWECYRAVRLMKTLTFNVELPNILFSGAETNFEFQIVTDQKISAKVYCRPQFPENVLPRKEEFTVQLTGDKNEYHASLQVRPLARGQIRVEKATLRVYLARAFSGWQFDVRCQGQTASLVYPNALGTQEGKLQGFLKIAQGQTLTHHRLGEGREFDSLRRYNQGDDLRRVDWKRSARGKGLLVKVYRPETHQRINIALDCGRRMGNLIDQRLQIEHAADAASHLIRAAKSGDDEIGLFAFNHLVQAQIPVARGSRQEKLIADSLVEIEVGSLESDYQLLGTWAASNRKRCLLVLITSISNPAGLEVIKNALWPVRRKHLPLVCAISDRDLNDLIGSPATNLDDAYIISAGMQQVAQVKMRLQQLKRMGIESIYCDAKQLPQELCNKYIELKSGGRL